MLRENNYDLVSGEVRAGGQIDPVEVTSKNPTSKRANKIGSINKSSRQGRPKMVTTTGLKDFNIVTNRYLHMHDQKS
jgi:hypothetical protein